MSRVRSYLQLLRAPATPTAASNILLGYLVVNGGWSPLGPLAALLVSSISIYSAGMVLNDVADIDEDRLVRKNRPLPSGRISLSAAKRLGWALLALGIAAACLPIFMSTPDELRRIPWRSAIVAFVLALTVIAYDFWLKRTWIGPFCMGSCRFLNVLLGMSTGPVAVESLIAGFTAAQISIAAGVGIFVVGLSWLARRETEVVGRSSIALPSLIMALALIWLAALPWWKPLQARGQTTFAVKIAVVVLFGLITTPLVLRIVAALRRPVPEAIQAAVTLSLFSLILIDAILAFAASGGQPAYGLAIAALILPSLWFARWAKAT